MLTSVPGIGRKGAQRIVLELAGRLGAPADIGVPAPLGRARAVRRSGKTRSGPVSSASAGRPGRPTRRSRRSSLTSTAEAADVDVAVALRAALRVLGRP